MLFWWLWSISLLNASFSFMFGYVASGVDGKSPAVKRRQLGSQEAHLRSKKHPWDLPKAGTPNPHSYAWSSKELGLCLPAPLQEQENGAGKAPVLCCGKLDVDSGASG